MRSTYGLTMLEHDPDAGCCAILTIHVCLADHSNQKPALTPTACLSVRAGQPVVSFNGLPLASGAEEPCRRFCGPEHLLGNEMGRLAGEEHLR